MKTTRRGLFGIFAGFGAAAAVVPAPPMVPSNIDILREAKAEIERQGPNPGFVGRRREPQHIQDEINRRTSKMLRLLTPKT